MSDFLPASSISSSSSVICCCSGLFHSSQGNLFVTGISLLPECHFLHAKLCTKSQLAVPWFGLLWGQNSKFLMILFNLRMLFYLRIFCFKSRVHNFRIYDFTYFTHLLYILCRPWLLTLRKWYVLTKNRFLRRINRYEEAGIGSYRAWTYYQILLGAELKQMGWALTEKVVLFVAF